MRRSPTPSSSLVAPSPTATGGTVIFLFVSSCCSLFRLAEGFLTSSQAFHGTPTSRGSSTGSSSSSSCSFASSSTSHTASSAIVTRRARSGFSLPPHTMSLPSSSPREPPLPIPRRRGRRQGHRSRDIEVGRSFGRSVSGQELGAALRLADRRRFELFAEGGTTAAAGAAAMAGTGAATGGRRAMGGRKSPSLGVNGVVDRAGRRDKELFKLQEKLKRFAGLRMWRQALTAFDEAKKKGVPLNSVTYTHAINAMSKGGRWKEAIDLLEELIAGGSNSQGARIAPSVVSYNAAITACARGRRPDMGLELLRGMQKRSGISPDRYSYAAAMAGLAKAGKPTKAMELLEEMKAVGMEPDFVCLSSAMEACELRGAWKEAVLILEQVRDCDPPASPQILTTILTSAIGSCIVDGAWEQATDFLTDVRMAHGGALPPAAAFAAAANSCARAGQAIRAQALINELAGGSGERPTIECYNAVVAGCAIAGDLKGAVKILKETVPEAGLKADTRGVNHLISGCAKAGEWKMALTFLDEQRAGAFPNAPPDRGSYNAALDACGRGGQVEAALALLGAMRSLAKSNKRLRPDRYSYGGALQACQTAADYKAALDLLGCMKGDGVRSDQRCSLAAVGTCVEAGRGEEAADVLEGMVAAGMSTSDGARALAKEACMEALSKVGSGGKEGLERALRALRSLDAAADEKAAARSKERDTQAVR